MESKLRQFKAIRNKFFNIISNIIRADSNSCIPPADGIVPKEVTNNPKKHRTRYVHKLQKPLPEVLTYNLLWEGSPKPTEILKVLLTLPEVFTPRDMYSVNDDKTKYVLKGMICFQAAHYLAFFRRILIKYDYLEADYETL